MSMVYPSSALLSPAGSVFRKENSLVPSGTSSFKTILLSLFFSSLCLHRIIHEIMEKRFFEHRGQLTITQLFHVKHFQTSHFLRFSYPSRDKAVCHCNVLSRSFAKLLFSFQGREDIKLFLAIPRIFIARVLTV